MGIVSIHRITRLKNWKNYILPFLLGVIFASVYIYAIPFDTTWRIAGLLMLSITGTAAYGYLLNNIFDLEEDQRASKSNYTAGMSAWSKTMYAITFLLLALAPWLFLPVTFLNFGLFVLQLALLAAYSIPPSRLKRFVHIGVITDALYNSLIMVFVIVLTIKEHAEIPSKNEALILVVLIGVLFLKGLRGILLHQLADRKNDLKAGLNTFVLYYGPLATNNVIVKVMLPMELILNIILVFTLSEMIPGLLWYFIAFLVYKVLTLRCWNIWSLLKWDYRFMFLYTLNDWYEEWLPLYMLVLLSIWETNFVFVLIPYVLIFPTYFLKLYKDIPNTIKNFNDDIKKTILQD